MTRWPASFSAIDGAVGSADDAPHARAAQAAPSGDVAVLHHDMLHARRMSTPWMPAFLQFETRAGSRSRLPPRRCSRTRLKTSLTNLRSGAGVTRCQPFAVPPSRM